MAETRIYIDVVCEDDGGISPDEWDLPDDCTAESIIALLKKDSHNIHRAISDFDLLQWPTIRVSVRRDGHHSDAEWSAP